MYNWHYLYAQNAWQTYIHAFVKHASVHLSGENMLHLGLLPECSDLLSYTHIQKYNLNNINNADNLDYANKNNTANNNADYLHLFPAIQDERFDCILAIHYLDNIHKEQQNATMSALSRILKPYGKLIILQFNPYGLWHWWHKAVNILPLKNHYHCTSYTHMQNMLLQHNLYVEQAQFAVYDLPFKRKSKLRQNIQNKINKMGQRWWPHCSNMYAFIAVKNIAGMHVMPINDAYSQQNTNQKLIYTSSQSS